MQRLAPELVEGDGRPEGDPPSWRQLADRARGLAADTDDPWYAGQLRGIETTCRVRAGEQLPWLEQVERCHDVRPELGDVEAYAAAHADLDDLLPGTGDLVTRLAAHRAGTAVPPHRLHAALTDLTSLLRAATPGRPAGESVQTGLVDDAPWSGLCRRTGPLRSSVAVSRSRPWPAASLVALAAHETYPGHHHERCRREHRPERQVAVLGTPECVVTEGLGETALRASGVRLEECGGVLGLDLRLAAAVADAAAPLARVKQDAALLLHSAGPQAARDHLVRWGLHDARRADAQVAFAQHPRWQVHATAYGEGARLVGGWLDRGGSYDALLDAPVTPQLLRDGPRVARPPEPGAS